MTKSKVVGAVATVVLIILAVTVPGAFGLSQEGLRCLLMFFAFLASSLSGLIPFGMASVVFTFLMFFSGGFPSMSEAAKGISVGLMAFCIGTMAITVALKRTTIPNRVAAFAAKISRGSSRIIILFFMFAACLLSSIMSNVAACTTIAAMAFGICKAQEDSGSGITNFGKCMMIGIPFAAGIGGCGTIAGSVNNLMGMEMLTAFNGSTIQFGPWAALMIPTTLIAMVIIWLILIVIWRPEPLDAGIVKSTMSKESGSKMSSLDKRVTLVIVLMVVFWISTTWITAYNVNFVAIAGLILFLLLGCFKWKEFNGECHWDSVFLCGGVMGVVQALINTGVGEWLGEVLFGGAVGLNPIILGMLIILSGFILHAFIPVGGPIASILTLPAVTLCASSGLDPAIGVLLVLVGANTCTLLPIDMLPILTRTYGYYKSSDFIKAGIPVTIALTVLLPLIMIPLGSLCGF